MAMNSDELSRLRERVAIRERPYDLEIAPDNQLYEYTDPRNEQATIERWQPVLEKLGIPILGVRDVPDEPVWVMVDGVQWELKRMKTSEYQVPETTFHLIRAAEAANVPFAWWIYGEEQFDRPQFRPIQKQQSRSLRSRFEETYDAVRDTLDPCVIGVIPTAPNRGIWCLLGKWFH
jgi:hypothetical protein